MAGFPLLLALVVLRLCRHVELIFDGADNFVESLDRQLWFCAARGEKFGWAPSHEAFPAGAVRRM
jgi:hypothetical protein